MSNRKNTADALAILLENLNEVNGCEGVQKVLEKATHRTCAAQEKLFGGKARMQGCFSKAVDSLAGLGLVRWVYSREYPSKTLRLTDKGAEVSNVINRGVVRR